MGSMPWSQTQARDPYLIGRCQVERNTRKGTTGSDCRPELCGPGLRHAIARCTTHRNRSVHSAIDRTLCSTTTDVFSQEIVAAYSSCGYSECRWSRSRLG